MHGRNASKNGKNVGDRQTFDIASAISKCAHTKSAVFQCAVNK